MIQPDSSPTTNVQNPSINSMHPARQPPTYSTPSLVHTSVILLETVVLPHLSPSRILHTRAVTDHLRSSPPRATVSERGERKAVRSPPCSPGAAVGSPSLLWSLRRREGGGTPDLCARAVYRGRGRFSADGGEVVDASSVRVRWWRLFYRCGVVLCDAVEPSAFGVLVGVDLAKVSALMLGLLVLQLLLRSGAVFTGGGVELVRFWLCRWFACALLWSGFPARCGGRGGVGEALAMPLSTASFLRAAGLFIELLRAETPSALSSTACGDRGVAPTDAAYAPSRLRRSWRTTTAATQRGWILYRSDQAI